MYSSCRTLLHEFFCMCVNTSVCGFNVHLFWCSPWRKLVSFRLWQGWHFSKVRAMLFLFCLKITTWTKPTRSREACNKHFTMLSLLHVCPVIHVVFAFPLTAYRNKYKRDLNSKFLKYCPQYAACSEPCGLLYTYLVGQYPASTGIQCCFCWSIQLVIKIFFKLITSCLWYRCFVRRLWHAC